MYICISDLIIDFISYGLHSLLITMHPFSCLMSRQLQVSSQFRFCIFQGTPYLKRLVFNESSLLNSLLIFRTALMQQTHCLPMREGSTPYHVRNDEDSTPPYVTFDMSCDRNVGQTKSAVQSHAQESTAAGDITGLHLILLQALDYMLC